MGPRENREGVQETSPENPFKDVDHRGNQEMRIGSLYLGPGAHRI